MNEQTEGAVVDQEEPKAPKFLEVEYDLDAAMVFFNYGDGTVQTLGLNDLNDEMKLRVALHGINQKVRDSAAGAKGDYAKAQEATKSVIDQLLSGAWRAARGEGEAKPRITELAAAISRLKGIELEVATKAVTEASDEKRKEWRAHPRIKAAIATIRAEKAQADLAKAGEVADIAL
jgi:hypothetical protein